MANQLILRDYEKWKSLNQTKLFSLYDYLFHITKMNHINTDIYFAFSELFWPKFLVYKDFVFLKENFSPEKLEGLLKQNEKIEYWMNLFTVDSYFEQDEDRDSKAEALARALTEIWKIKLAKDFPHLSLVVEYVEDKEEGDYGLTFYQTKKI